MSGRLKFTLHSLALALLFTLLAATITSQTASATSTESRKTASGVFSASGPPALAFSACNPGQALGISGNARTTRTCAFSYGKEADQLSRLNYYGYRYYDPLSLQWTQADPLFRVAPDIAYDEPRRMSLYAFSLNNPVRYMDPDGQDPTFNANISKKSSRNLRRLYRRRSRAAFMKATLRAYKINGRSLGLQKVRRGNENLSGHQKGYNIYADKGFFANKTYTAKERMAVGVLTTLHEVAHLEFINLMDNLPMGSTTELSAASEQWALAVGIRGLETMLQAKAVSAEEYESIHFALVELHDAVRLEYKAADWEKGKKIYEKAHEQYESGMKFGRWVRNVAGGRLGGLVSASGK